MYEILNTKNGKRYIGSSNQLNRRETVHFSALRNNRHGNTHLQNSFNKYGKENFEFNVIVYCDESRQYEYEQYWLNRENAVENQDCYNESDEASDPPTMIGEDNPQWSENVEIVCKNCGKIYKKNPSKKDRSFYCTIGCRNEDKDYRGTGNGCSKLNDAQAINIKHLIGKSSLSYEKIAELYPISGTQVGKIGRGKAWGHIKI